MTIYRPRRGSGVSRHEIFGPAGGAEPATPGSYGISPGRFRLPATTTLGPVRLQVASLDRSLEFYRDVLGMERLGYGPSRLVLGAPGAVGDAAGAPGSGALVDTPLVELVERPGALPAPSRGRTGLFHFAILLPDRPALGRFAAHAAGLGLQLGASDHLVSESLYLHDPDGLGIEIYADRPRSAWRRLGRELMMATDPLDVDALVDAGADRPWQGMPAGAVMGHLHLHVGDIEAAADFYSEALGFDRLVWSYPGALFLGAGGYHHHLGTNVWAGPGATAPPADEAQLLEWTIELPDRASLAAAAESLEAASFGVERPAGAADGAEAVTSDPWRTRVRLRLPHGSIELAWNR